MFYLFLNFRVEMLFGAAKVDLAILGGLSVAQDQAGEVVTVLKIMIRLNSGNFAIFFSRESILILNNVACRALKIIQNDITIGTISWDFKVENSYFNFCMGENLGGRKMRYLEKFAFRVSVVVSAFLHYFVLKRKIFDVQS